MGSRVAAVRALGAAQRVGFECERTEGGVVFVVPLRLVSEANTPGGWRTRHARKDAQQGELRTWLRKVGAPPPGPWWVTITRLGPGVLDTDNLAGAGKHARDELARWLGIDDGQVDRVRWDYAQGRADPPSAYGVRIEVLTWSGRVCAACCGRGVVA